MVASIFDAKASFQVGDITVTLTVDPSKLTRPERYPAVRLWIKEVAAAMEKHLKDGSSQEYALGLFKAHSKTVEKAAPVNDDE